MQPSEFKQHGIISSSEPRSPSIGRRNRRGNLSQRSATPEPTQDSNRDSGEGELAVATSVRQGSPEKRRNRRRGRGLNSSEVPSPLVPMSADPQVCSAGIACWYSIMYAYGELWKHPSRQIVQWVLEPW